MKARWRAVAAKFSALQQREKLLVAAAAIFGAGLGGHSLGVEPVTMRAAALEKQLVQQKAEIQTLQAQIGGMRASMRDPDAPNRAALAETRQKIAVAEQALQAFDKKLVPPQRVPQLLQSMFTRHRGLQLLSLQTLPPLPLLAPPKVEGKAAAAPAEKGGNIHKHGIEIKMAGNYLDLLAYVAELEQLPQKLLWGRMSLATVAWPDSELTLTVYTLSLDPVWMVV